MDIDLSEPKWRRTSTARAVVKTFKKVGSRETLRRVGAHVSLRRLEVQEVLREGMGKMRSRMSMY